MNQKEAEGRNPSQKLTREGNTNQQRQSWYELPHEERVKAVKGYIHHWEQRTKGSWSPEYIIRRMLQSEADSGSDEERDRAKRIFFDQLACAWDAVAFNHYEPGSHEWHNAEFSLNTYASDPEGGPVIALTHAQAKTLDALTEACNIPHEQGQTEVAIPRQFHTFESYEQWLMSGKRRELIAKAEAKRATERE